MLRRIYNAVRLELVIRGRIVPEVRKVEPIIKAAPSNAAAVQWLRSRGIYEPKGLYGSPAGF